MADEHNIIYNIEVNTKNGKIKIDGITKGFEEASIAVKKLGEDTAASSAKSSNAIAGTVNAIKAEISALKSEQNAVAVNNKQWLEYQVKISGAEQRLRNLQKTQSKVNLTTKNFSKEQNKASDATGGATAAAMELGRVVSDAPYGIRGMANNITQLVSSLGYQAAATNVATGTTYGYVGAIKAMWAALTGPLGVVFAITAVVSLMDGLFGANKKAEGSTNDLKNKFQEFADVLRNNVNVSTKEYIELMRKKEAEYKIAGLNDETLSRDQLIEGMIANPKLIERPIVIKEGEARIGRPPENVLEIL